MKKLQNNYLKSLNKFFVIIGIVVFIVVCIFIYNYYIGNIPPDDFDIIFPICGITFIIGYTIFGFITAKDVQKYKNHFYDLIIIPIIKEYLPNSVFYQKIDKKFPIALASDIIHLKDNAFFKDYVKFQYTNLVVEYVYVNKAEVINDSDKIIFNGDWFCFSLPGKNYGSGVRIMIKERDYCSADDLYNNFNMSTISTENLNFNSRYNIYATNQHDAFYVLTPDMMEKILKMQDVFPNFRVIYFINNKIYIGIRRKKSLFDIEIKNKIDLEAEKKTVINKINVIMSYVKKIDLDVNLFERER